MIEALLAFPELLKPLLESIDSTGSFYTKQRRNKPLGFLLRLTILA